MSDNKVDKKPAPAAARLPRKAAGGAVDAHGAAGVSPFWYIIAMGAGLLGVVIAMRLPTLLGILKDAGIYPPRIIAPGTTSEAVSNCRRIAHDPALSCEDVVLHHPSGTAYFACDVRERREKHWPPLDHHDAQAAGSGGIYVMDLNDPTSKLTKIKLLDFPAGELTTHGLDLYLNPLDTDDITLHVVNHHPDGSRIEIFDHTFGSNTAKHAETVKSLDILPAPNNVFAVGKRSFYATNDMKKPKGIMRQVELFTFSKWSHAVYRDEKGMRIVAPDIGYPNGISASPDLKTVYIVSIVARAVLVYDRDESTGDLKLRETVDMGYMPDNLDVDPVTGDVLSAGHALLLDTLKYGERHTDVSPSMVVKVKTNRKGVKGGDGKNYTTEVVLSDDGHFLPGLTTAVSHRGTKKSILTSMYEAPVVCDGIF